MRKILSLFMIVSFGANAAISVISDNSSFITLNVTEQYTVGDNDTLQSAKNITIEQAKKSASDYAGTYVESILEVSDNKIKKEQVRVLTAGYLELQKADFRRTINSSGSIVLDVTAVIRVSKASIRDGLNNLKNNPMRQKKMDDLERANKQLRSELLELTNKINTGASRNDLLDARDKVLKQLNSNRNATKQIFQEGTLFELALLDSSEYEYAKKDVIENVFGYMVHESTVTTDKPKFAKNKDGSYRVLVPVTWNISGKRVNDVLSQYLSFYTDRKYTIKISANSNNRDNQKKPYSKDLFDYMFHHRIAIKVQIGPKVGYLPVMSRGSSWDREDIFIQYSNESKTNRLIRYDFRNPIVINNLTESELKSATTINAEMVLIDEKTLSGFKYE